MPYETAEPTVSLRWVERPTAAPSRVLQQQWRIIVRGGEVRGAWHVDRYEWRDVPMEAE